jgi:hypothetical protein
MTIRSLIPLALLASAAAGVGFGVLVSQVAGPDDDHTDVKSITGISSGVDGTRDKKEEEKKGVDEVAVPPETPPTTDPPTVTDSDPNSAESQTVDIEGVEGTEGVDAETENTIEIFTTNDGTMQSIRGIKGIDTVMLQNLETVLRMQAPPPEPEEGGGGGGRAAAALLTMEAEEPPEPEEEEDGRDELTELDLEGS